MKKWSLHWIVMFPSGVIIFGHGGGQWWQKTRIPKKYEIASTDNKCSIFPSYGNLSEQNRHWTQFVSLRICRACSGLLSILLAYICSRWGAAFVTSAGSITICLLVLRRGKRTILLENGCRSSVVQVWAWMSFQFFPLNVSFIYAPYSI